MMLDTDVMQMTAGQLLQLAAITMPLAKNHQMWRRRQL